MKAIRKLVDRLHRRLNPDHYIKVNSTRTLRDLFADRVSRLDDHILVLERRLSENARLLANDQRYIEFLESGLGKALDQAQVSKNTSRYLQGELEDLQALIVGEPL